MSNKVRQATDDRGQRFHLDPGFGLGADFGRRRGSRAVPRRSRSAPRPWSAAADGTAGSVRPCAWRPSCRQARRSAITAPLGAVPARTCVERLGLAGQGSRGGRRPRGRFLVRHVDHARPAAFVDMAETGSCAQVPQARHQPGERAGPVAAVEFVAQHQVPAVAAGAGRAGQAEDEGVVDLAGEGARLQRRQARPCRSSPDGTAPRSRPSRAGTAA